MEVIARTIFAFISLLTFSRLLGKKQMSHITLFNYITGITFGSIAADIAIETHISVVDGIISLTVWSLLTIGTGKLSLKFPRIRVLLDGEPTIVIKKERFSKKQWRPCISTWMILACCFAKRMSSPFKMLIMQFWNRMEE
ncbi:DUF421 domain-containing protein [Paenibacillus sp. E194]|uniref:DUF421 domain-containing protein n=1 Tax=Paenibacillus sp. E194 TaxID=1458845 RepID=UPI000ABF54D7